MDKLESVVLERVAEAQRNTEQRIQAEVTKRMAAVVRNVAADLPRKVQTLEAELTREREARRYAQTQLDYQRTRVAQLEKIASGFQARAELDALLLEKENRKRMRN